MLQKKNVYPSSLPFWPRLARPALGFGLLGLCALPACGPEAPPASATAELRTAQAQALTGALRDRYIVLYRDEVPAATAAASTDRVLQLGGKVHHRYGAALKGFAATLPPGAVAALRKDPQVKLIEPDALMEISAVQPDPPWGLDRIDQRARPLDSRYAYGGDAWIAQDGAGVDVYVLDTGVRLTHNEFGGRAVFGVDAVEGQWQDDCNGHGTHVAGTIAGQRYGVAKGARIISVRVFGCGGSGPISNVIAGVDWVTAHHPPGQPAVANMSLSGGPSDALDEAVRRSIQDGVTYVLAAGNASGDACQASPARTAEALTVGASDGSDSQAGFSNSGSCLDLYAPGVDVLSAGRLNDSDSATSSGTSMAAPHVAGAAALYLGQVGAVAPDNVARTLLGNASLNRLSGLSIGSPNRLLFSSPQKVAAFHFYNGATGTGATARVDGTGGFTTLWSSAGYGSWTHFAPAGGDQMFLYDAPSGEAVAGRVGDDGTFTTVRALGSMGSGWRNVIGTGDGHVLFYEPQAGGLATGLMGFGGMFTIQQLAFTGISGWTHVVGSAGNMVLFYNAQNGQGATAHIAPDGTVNYLQSYTGFSVGWTSIVATTDGMMLFYNSTSGTGAIGRIDAAGNFTTLSSLPGIGTGWSHLAAGSYGQILLYKAGSGLTFGARVDDAASFAVEAVFWLSPWTHIAPRAY